MSAKKIKKPEGGKKQQGKKNHTFVSLAPRHLNQNFWASFGHDLAILQNLPLGAAGLWQTA